METAITLAFADGQYDFHLGLAQINEIQIATGVGIGALYARLMKGRYLIGDQPLGNPLEAEYKMEDLTSVIKQGLIGGGKGVVDGVDVTVTAFRANELIQNYVLAAGRPLEQAWETASAVLGARIIGYTPPEDAKPQAPSKKKAVKGAGSTSQEPSPTAP